MNHGRRVQIGEFHSENFRTFSSSKMATMALPLENDAVHSLPPFANQQNKQLSKKVRVPNTEYLDQEFRNAAV